MWVSEKHVELSNSKCILAPIVIASTARANDNACAYRGNSGELHNWCESPIVLCGTILTTVVEKKNIKPK